MSALLDSVRRTRRAVVARTGLRTRVVAAFSAVFLLVTSSLAVLTWQLSSGYMVDQRETSASRQAVLNARLVRDELARDGTGLVDLLAGLGVQRDSGVLVRAENTWVSTRGMAEFAELPDPVRELLDTTTAVRQRVIVDGRPALAVVIPLPDVVATYVDIFPLSELDRNLRFLSWMLAAGVVLSVLAGALIGRWASSRAFRPLSELTSAAAKAADGDLTVRLPPTADPDLAPLSEAFNDTAQRLKDRVERDARFAGDVSHELRSPLTTMVNAMSVLRRRRGEMSPSAAEAVDLLDTDVHRLRRMVEELLEISRIDQGGDELDFEIVDLEEILERGLASGAAAGHPGLLDVQASPQVIGDRRRLERVVVNLTDNAALHGNGLVRVGLERRGGMARIEVDDAGPGIAEEDADRIFERFARGSPADRGPGDGGVGLGLALVAEHVKAHRGLVWVEQRPGGGARFVVELLAVET